MKESLELTIEEFKKIDVKEACQKSGAILKDEKTIIVRYLNSDYIIHLPEVEITSPDVKLTDNQKNLILHYIITSKTTLLTGKLIDFRLVPGGNMYYSVFEARVHKPLLKTFGNNPEVFMEAGKSFGGIKAEYGNFALTFQVFPKVLVTFILYPGDEEFPPDCKVLFDSSISDYLSTEGIAVACEELVKELVTKPGEKDYE
ncbi:hypothetical protein AUJ66_06750 [Candidatus Desantisbacteria bacterium CG1_02_38_46]|uniref:DUF3786 domain-containing protein n=3 Tax=unclassified Candidatus Desantisiibacteriota TaxID=3106372 RepID=A0A2H9PA82_9BACT|nr:MAG: hypothetical protein AUJ66_06750 [Candidatus Desantisbacteria bacterium CG1_02_38_46]PIU51084.1 MAG: hypothetical protein COS91_06300 [Candidatus Desantisbacteria bacterium CG07_land_8_20_14_0_80_39_15]PIZ15280.1 MAG: hypothetical protein COY51_05705 [Candidatus Desantisbacteria bacterium CG_4_10_14_0_8_um_filter_39_17]